MIFIGSRFGMENNPIPSAFARNSRLVDVTDVTGSFNGAQFSFAGNEGEPSPFAYVPSAAENRCGVSKSGNQHRIEVLGCAKPILLTFITGFVHYGSALDLAAITIIDKTAYSAGGGTDVMPASTSMVSNLQTSSSSPEYIYQASASDTIVGPTLIFDVGFEGNFVTKIQHGLIFIGLKTFSATYPLNIPDSFIVAVGGVGYTGAAISIGALPATTISDAFKTPVNTELDLQNYNGNTGTHLGHSFCGLTVIGG